ncbi:MAG TPA: SAM-dependent methyltransferase [Bryobacteraceae bacterium]|nr:SAM-dependent methyltransferase [Bryobacteraceae bacterium]
MIHSFIARYLPCFFFLAASGILVASSSSAPMGKFYIVGMGTAPDLITVRGQNVIARADILMAEEGAFQTMWAGLARGKGVWEWSHNLRRFYGADPKTLKDPNQRTLAENMEKARRQLIGKIVSAVAAGKVVACLQGGDPMMYGMTLFLEMLPPNIPSEVVPGVGAFQAASAALKMSPPYGYDTNAVILTMADWPGRVDVNEKLMATGSTMVFYTMNLNYPSLFAQLKRYYPADTPVAVVSNAGDPNHQKVTRSTVSRFLEEVDPRSLPANSHMLFVGKFLSVGQARKDFTPRITTRAGGK